MTVKEMPKAELSLYRRWSAMKARCNPDIKHDEPHRRNYSGKGIRVCPEWQDWPNFRDWAYENGYSPELTLDRMDGDDDYYPDNCRWVDWKTQRNNLSETTIREKEARRQIAKEKPKKKYQNKQQLELQRFRKWYADKMGIKEVPKLTPRYMKMVIEEGYYKPMYL